MIKSVLKRLGYVQEKHPLLVILIVLTITSFFAYYAVRLQTDSSFSVMFRNDAKSQQLERLVDNEFGGTDTLFVLVKVDNTIDDKTRIQDIRHPDVLKAISSLSNALRRETFIPSVITLPDLLMQTNGRLPQSLEESKKMIASLPQDVKSRYLSSFLSDDFQFQNIIVSVSVEETPGYLQKVESSVREKIEQTPFPIGVSAELTGMPVLMNRIMTYLINDNLSTILLAIIGVFLILWFYFKTWKIALFSVIPVILTLAWLAGTMHLLDIRITVMTASIGAMMIGMSVDYGIHLTHRFHENIRYGKQDALRDSVVGVGSALFASIMTTIAGFYAMTLGVSPNSITQGTVLAIGIAFAFIITITFLPPLMHLQRKYIYSKLDETIFSIRGKTRSISKNPIDRFLIGVARWQTKSPGTVIAIVIAITILIIPGFSLVYLDTDADNWIPDGDDVLLGLQNVGNNFGGTESLNLIFMLRPDPDEDIDPNAVTDLRDPRVLIPMSSLDTVISKLRWVNSVDSPSSAISQLNSGRIPRNIDDIKDIIRMNPQAASNYNEDFSISLMTVRADEIDREDYFGLLREMEGINFPAGLLIEPQGSIPEDIEFEQTMGSDTINTALIGFVLVILIASLFYRSILSGLLAFVPIVFAILWTVGMMGYINLPFTVLTTGMLAILMGMGIDFSIHLIHSIREKMEEYGHIEKAIPEALMSTGTALSITTITTVIGFMALSFATLVNTMRLGWTLALGILMTFFSCTLIVPAVMALQYNIQRRRSHKAEGLEE